MARTSTLYPLALCLLLVGSPALARPGTASVVGSVVDADSGSALPYATVVLTRTAGDSTVYRATAANLHGRYSLRDIPPDTYQIQATFIGYSPSVVTRTLVAGQVARCNLELSAAPLPVKPEAPLQLISAPEVMRRVANTPHLAFLHARYTGCRDYTFAAHATQRLHTRLPERAAGWTECYLTGFFTEPDTHKQQVVAYRSHGRWELSLSPGLMESPAAGTVEGRRFQAEPTPISPEGLESYAFQSVSTILMGDTQVSRIAVSPLDRRRPGLVGDLWIAVGDYALVGYDLRLNRAALRDLHPIVHWRAYQQNALFYDRYWLPVRQEWEIRSDTHTCKAETDIYNYRLNQGTRTGPLAGPDLQILPDAEDRAPEFWASMAAGQDTLGWQYRHLLSSSGMPAAWRRAAKP